MIAGSGPALHHPVGAKPCRVFARADVICLLAAVAVCTTARVSNAGEWPSGPAEGAAMPDLPWA